MNNIFTVCGSFSVHNRFFVTPELQHDQYPFTFKRFVMLNCIGTRYDKPIYTEYAISVIKYTDGSNNELITNWRSSYSMDYDSELIKYLEQNYQELDNSFMSTFMLMYNNVESMKLIHDSFNNVTQDFYLKNYFKESENK